MKNKEVKKEKTKTEMSKYSSVLKSPRVTEKANILMQENVYVFEVALGATKAEITKAVKDMHKVTPVRVNIVRNPEKSFFVRGKKSTKHGIKKAYVALKKGDSIKS